MPKNNKILREFLDKSPTAEIREILRQHEDLQAMAGYIFDDRSPPDTGRDFGASADVKRDIPGEF